MKVGERRRLNRHLVFGSDPFSLSSAPLHILKDSIFMNYLSAFENIKLVMSLSCVLSPRASQEAVKCTKKKEKRNPASDRRRDHKSSS